MSSMFRNSKKVSTALKVKDILKEKKKGIRNDPDKKKSHSTVKFDKKAVVTLSDMVQFLQDNSGDLDLLYSKYVGDLEYRKQMADEAYMLYNRNK